jgi:hypothetical protein
MRTLRWASSGPRTYFHFSHHSGLGRCRFGRLWKAPHCTAHTAEALAGLSRSKRIRVLPKLLTNFTKKLGLKKRIMRWDVGAKEIVVSFFQVVEEIFLSLPETNTHPKLSSHGQVVTVAKGGSIAARGHSRKQITFHKNMVVLTRPVIPHVLPGPVPVFDAATGGSKVGACRARAAVHQPRFEEVTRRVNMRVTMTTTNRLSRIILICMGGADANTTVRVHR